jgi:hypothetical protein
VDLIDELGQPRTGRGKLRERLADQSGLRPWPRLEQPGRRRVDGHDGPAIIHHDDPLHHALQDIMRQSPDSVELAVHGQVAPPLPDEDQGAEHEHRRDREPGDDPQGDLLCAVKVIEVKFADSDQGI